MSQSSRQTPPAKSRCLLQNDGPLSGVWNMAADEALLTTADQSGQLALRFYQWQSPTLSLGYFQGSRERLGHESSELCELVRRASGGGAILHDQELTYSIVLPRSHALARQPQQLYYAVHEELIAILAAHGCQARLCPAPEETLDPAWEPFLCFQRRAAGDVLVGDSKIAGSAQRRSRGAVLQHGSILLARSPWAPELPGLAELGCEITAERLRAELLQRLPQRLGLELYQEPETAAYLSLTARLAQQKFGSDAWTHKR